MICLQVAFQSSDITAQTSEQNLATFLELFGDQRPQRDIFSVKQDSFQRGNILRAFEPAEICKPVNIRIFRSPKIRRIARTEDAPPPVSTIADKTEAAPPEADSSNFCVSL